MTAHPPDRSRDRRIEDPTNLWVIHPAGRGLLPWFVARGISANAVSVGGLLLGALAALAYSQWTVRPLVFAGLLLTVGWLIADGLDGMIARATGTASALGRVLDGLCDHGVFALLYLALAISLGTAEGWALAIAAGIAHAVQSNLYESERARFHRRSHGLIGEPPSPSGNPLVRLYDHVAGTIDRFAFAFDAAMRRQPDPAQFGSVYAAQAAAPMRLMRLLTANVRVGALFIACLAGDPRWFWWFELGPLTAILIIGLFWHRAIEVRLVRDLGIVAAAPAASVRSPTQRT